MHHSEKLESGISGTGWELPEKCRPAEVVHAGMLVVEGLVEDTATETKIREHTFDKRFEFYESVVKLGWDRALELHLVGLETEHISIVILELKRVTDSYFSTWGFPS